MQWVLLIVLLLPGCQKWEMERLAAVNADRANCADRMMPDWSQKERNTFMSRCLAIQPGGGSGSTTFSAAPMGAPDQFGPFGYRGPTWEQFNQPFQDGPMVVPPPPTRR